MPITLPECDQSALNRLVGEGVLPKEKGNHMMKWFDVVIIDKNWEDYEWGELDNRNFIPVPEGFYWKVDNILGFSWEIQKELGEKAKEEITRRMVESGFEEE